MRVGIFTAGGDAPGLNAVVRASARRLLAAEHEPVGLLRGMRGLADPAARRPLDLPALRGIVGQGGTILQSSSYDPFREPDGLDRVRAAQQSDPLDALIAIGGEHTMAIARRLHTDVGLEVVGVPKTIDNDVPGTDFTFGFDTAIEVATEAIDRLRTTAQSHDRVMVVEVMGRNTGWIATFAGIAGGADGIVVPELELTVEELAEGIRRRHEAGKTFSIIVVSEGAELAFASGEKRVIRAAEQNDPYGYPRLGGIGAALAKELEQRTGYEARVTVLGHIQRGGPPSATDRVLATRYGLLAADLVLAGTFGRMVALRAGELTSIPLEEVEGLKTLDLSYLDVARTFFD